MELYTIGFTKKSAEQFFSLLRAHRVRMLVDIRLNNRSQLAGFTKGDDLRYFLAELCACRYEHRVEYAPTKELLESYQKKQIDWDGYVRQYIPLMERRRAPQDFLERFSGLESVCLLCSEPTAEKCHRRLFAEMVAALDPGVTIRHI